LLISFSFLSVSSISLSCTGLLTGIPTGLGANPIGIIGLYLIGAPGDVGGLLTLVVLAFPLVLNHQTLNLSLNKNAIITSIIKIPIISIQIHIELLLFVACATQHLSEAEEQEFVFSVSPEEQLDLQSPPEDSHKFSTTVFWQAPAMQQLPSALVSILQVHS